jgi:hypothetical protein
VEPVDAARVDEGRDRARAALHEDRPEALAAEHGQDGARTISAFIDAGCIDRLHILMAPVLIGSGRIGLDLVPIRALAEARRPPTRAYALPDGNVLFDCDLRRAGARPGQAETGFSERTDGGEECPAGQAEPCG